LVVSVAENVCPGDPLTTAVTGILVGHGKLVYCGVERLTKEIFARAG
jgi:hypothetical protein